MLISRKEVLQYLNGFFTEEDRNHKHIDLIVDLSWMGIIIFEFGFQCPKDKQEETKEKLLDLIQRLSDVMTEAKVETKIDDYDQKYVFAMENKNPTNEDLTLVCEVFHKLVVQEEKISKEKILEWLTEAWSFGTQQQRIYNMETEGSIMNEYGIVISFGADLAMFGESKDFLPG